MKIFFKKILLVSTILLTFQAFAQATVSDGDILKSIKSQISNNPVTSSAHVTVDSQAGNVILTGIVTTDHEADALVEMAQSTPGVIDVNTDNLKVKESKQPFADTVVTAKIKGLFLREKLFSDKDIASTTVKVETKNGVVYLTGSANSAQAVENAVQISRSVKGVTKVVSHIKTTD